MKKIFITITNNIAYDQRMHKIASSLSDDFNVTIIGANTRNPPKLANQIYSQKRLNIWFKKGKLFYVEYNIRLFFYLIFRKYDIHYSVDLDSLLAGYLLKKLKNIKLVFDAHEYFTEVPELIGRTFVQKVWRKIGLLAVPYSDKCITVNKSLSSELKSLYGKSFEVIRNVPVLQRENEVKHMEKLPKILLYQGALNEGRGVEYMISTASTLPEYELWIAGDGPLKEKLINQADQTPNVKFLGMLSSDELKEVTRKAYLGLNLLESESKNYYYSLANKFFDYTEAEVPSINMNFPAYIEMNNIIEVSYLISEDKLIKLADVIRKITHNELKYKELVNNCSKARLLWNWQEESLKLKALFSDLL